jgi:hypothetical protein
MEFLQELIARLPALLAAGDMLPALLLIGAGTSIFLIADNGAQGFSVLNGLFVILGYLAGTLVTLAGLYLAWQAFAPVAETLPAVLPASPPSPPS